MRRVMVGVLAAALFGAALVSPSGAGEKRLPEVIQLPTGFQPEGIATGSVFPR